MKLLKNYRFGAKRSERKIRVSHKTKITLQTAVALSAVTIGLGAANVVTGNSGQNSPAVHAATTSDTAVISAPAGYSMGSSDSNGTYLGGSFNPLQGLGLNGDGNWLDLTNMPTGTSWSLGIQITNPSGTIVYNHYVSSRTATSVNSTDFPSYSEQYGANPEQVDTVTYDFAYGTATSERTQNLTLWACYALDFQASGVNSEYVYAGDSVPVPKNPTKAGYTFAGWYADAALTQPFDFTAAMSGDTYIIPVYPKWTADTATQTQYSVSYISNGGSVIDSPMVNDGSTLTKPADPTKSGYTFAGWYTDQDLTQAYDFTSPVTSNLVLYAKWTADTTTAPAPTQYTVNFNSNGGNQIGTMFVDAGNTVGAFTPPEKSGYTFAGWYTDAALTQPFDMATPINSNLLLYAKWTPNSSTTPTHPKYTVTLENPDGTVLSSQTVVEGSTLTKPANPTKSGYTFAGWYTDKGLTTAYDFTKAVTGDVTLYAKWAAVSTSSTATKPAKTVATTAKTTPAVKINATTAKVTATGVATKPTLPKTGEASTLPISIAGLISLLGALVIGLRRKF